MKPGIRLIAAVAVLTFAAAAPAFAQNTDRPTATSTSNEMSISDSPAENPIAAPAVTAPSSAADVIVTVPHPSAPVASSLAPQKPAAQNSSAPKAMPFPVTAADAKAASQNAAPSATETSGDASNKPHYLVTSPSPATPAEATSEASSPPSDGETDQGDANQSDGADAASTAEVNQPATANTAPAPTNSAEVKTPASATDLKQSVLAPKVAEQPKKDSIATPQQSLAMTAGEVLYNQTHDASMLDPMSWSVSVYKLRHELAVYYKGRFFRKYDAVFGRNLDNAPKAYAQDRRTPEGVYTIIKKYPSNRFRWFLRLNYPNNVDRIRYEAMRDDGVVPVGDHGQVTPVGSAIGIHGTDVPILNAGHVNWTTGCISVGNNEIDDLERMLPIGTVVIIKP